MCSWSQDNRLSNQSIKKEPVQELDDSFVDSSIPVPSAEDVKDNDQDLASNMVKLGKMMSEEVDHELASSPSASTGKETENQDSETDAAEPKRKAALLPSPPTESRWSSNENRRPRAPFRPHGPGWRSNFFNHGARMPKRPWGYNGRMPMRFSSGPHPNQRGGWRAHRGRNAPLHLEKVTDITTNEGEHLTVKTFVPADNNRNRMMAMRPPNFNAGNMGVPPNNFMFRGFQGPPSNFNCSGFTPNFPAGVFNVGNFGGGGLSSQPNFCTGNAGGSQDVPSGNSGGPPNIDGPTIPKVVDCVSPEKNLSAAKEEISVACSTTPSSKPKEDHKLRQKLDPDEITAANNLAKRHAIQVGERHFINELLVKEPQQSSKTMFKLLIWEIYYHYFAEVSIFYFLYAHLLRYAC